MVLVISSDESSLFQMLEVCSPVVSSTSHPEMKAAMRTGQGAGPGYHAVAGGENNIGSIISMLIGR